MATRTLHNNPESGYDFEKSEGHTLRGPQEDKTDIKDKNDVRDKSDVKKSSGPTRTGTSTRNVKTDGQNDGDDNDIDQKGEGNRGENRGHRNKIRQNIPPPPPGLSYMKWIGVLVIALGILMVWDRWLLK
ncbi:hypothetical protein F4677DRAFT_449701 [Hypoxylon crocopeplum]|nr:hypothetical protein F4677DRAFT_449701 [Hypoxylon crocopeplum]